jgi:hypothetical protein
MFELPAFATALGADLPVMGELEGQADQRRHRIGKILGERLLADGRRVARPADGVLRERRDSQRRTEHRDGRSPGPRRFERHAGVFPADVGDRVAAPAHSV